MVTFFNKNVLITGAKGISKSLAVAFAKERANIGIFTADKNAMIELERDLGNLRIRNYGYKCNIGDHHELMNAVALYKRQFEMADVIIINIDLHEDKDLIDISADELEAELALSVNGTISIVKQFLPELLKKQEGAIMFALPCSRNVSPVGSAAMGAIERFSESLNSFFVKNGTKKVVSTVAYVSDASKPGLSEIALKALIKEKSVVKL